MKACCSKFGSASAARDARRGGVGLKRHEVDRRVRPSLSDTATVMHAQVVRRLQLTALFVSRLVSEPAGSSFARSRYQSCIKPV